MQPNVATSRYFDVYGQKVDPLPVILSVPHAGREYSPALLAEARVERRALERLEDRWVDALIEPALAAGFSAVVARSARALIDLNRAPDDLDPEVLSAPLPGLRPSARARAGLGLIPHRLHPEGALWRAPVTVGAYQQRLAHVHEPYHRTVSQLMQAACARWGVAVLIDVHSMPQPADGLQIVVGDRFGASAAHPFSLAASEAFRQTGAWVARNSPYAGGYIIERHGNPLRNRHALQIEFSRALYLDASGEINKAAATQWAATLLSVAQALSRVTQPASLDEAAE